MALETMPDGFRPLVLRAFEELDKAGHVAPDLKTFTDPGKKNDGVGSLVTYLEELRTWNARVDLTAARSAEEAVDLTLADAMVLATYGAEFVSHSRRWVDVGAGAGAPGLILALLRPNWPVTLVEPRSKRVAFLRSVIGRLNSAAEVRRMRSAELPEQQWDVAVSRATLNAGDWLREGTRLARHAVWVLLARGDIPERPGWTVEHGIHYRWPLTGAERRAICFVPEQER